MTRRPFASRCANFFAPADTKSRTLLVYVMFALLATSVYVSEFLQTFRADSPLDAGLALEVASNLGHDDGLARDSKASRVEGLCDQVPLAPEEPGSWSSSTSTPRAARRSDATSSDAARTAATQISLPRPMVKVIPTPS